MRGGPPVWTERGKSLHLIPSYPPVRAKTYRVLMAHQYPDRTEAGRVLARLIKRRPLAATPIVIGLPRGGVPVAFEVAEALRAPLDVLVVRKIGAPGHSELACGAFILGGEVVWNKRVLKALHLSAEDLEDIRREELKEAQRREAELRGVNTQPLAFVGASVIIVDDGLATGATMKAAVLGVLAQQPREVVVCIPVAPEESCREIENMGVSVICDQRISSGEFSSVGEWYRKFPQVSTEECRVLLNRSREVFGEGSGVSPSA